MIRVFTTINTYAHFVNNYGTVCGDYFQEDGGHDDNIRTGGATLAMAIGSNYWQELI